VINGEMHAGVDIAVAPQTTVRSIGDGVIVQVGSRYDGLGTTVVVDHQDGYMTLYGHVSGVTVDVGDVVSAGDVVARVAAPSPAERSHLHLAVSYTDTVETLARTAIDPLPWLVERHVNVGSCVSTTSPAPSTSPTT
jgi:murein DD-endopeptidase MepM/ murein hydrolase activator NlpD